MLRPRRYNTAMKLIFIGSSLWICYLMRVHRVIKQTYDASEDTFRVLFLLAPSAALALLINQKHNSPVEVLPAPLCQEQIPQMAVAMFDWYAAAPGVPQTATGRADAVPTAWDGVGVC